jgi:hypothetical protein
VSSRNVNVEKLSLFVRLNFETSEWDKKKWCRRLTMLFTDNNVNNAVDIININDADNAKTNDD